MSDLGAIFAAKVLSVFSRLCPQAQGAAPGEIEAVGAVMREKSRETMERMLREIKDAPWLAQIYFADAVLDTALAGRDALLKMQVSITKDAHSAHK